MPAKKKTVVVAAAPAAASPAQKADEEIEEIVPEPAAAQGSEPMVTFVLDEHAEHDLHEEEDDEFEEDEGYEDDHEDLEDDEDDALTTAVGQLTQLMMTEDGEAITDVLNGIRDSIEKQNKILYRGLQLLEARFARK